MTEVTGKGLPRAANLGIALSALILTSPILLLCLIAIRITGRGPVFYRQPRAGLAGRPFVLWKLRTMVQGSDPIGVGEAVTAADPRVTSVGRVLRALSLDELPNLFNVLSGEMAIVGPRPTLPAQIDLYTPHQRKRLDVRPGLTGWAQVNGRAGIPWEERIELDVWYVENRSVALDLRICLLTLPSLIRRRRSQHLAVDAYAGSDPDSPLRKAAERERDTDPSSRP
jgi:lipopolysaccharide/colanic/teichoic acid biosynthesis glycosyltransferase